MKRLIQRIFTLAMAGAMMASLSACNNSTPTQQAYRSIKVYQTTGQTVIEREKVGKMDAFENLKLLSGDLGEVFIDSNMRLQLDDDKFILIEEQSRLRIEAEGDSETSKTRINLLEGVVTCEIENKLLNDSTFEISTPNSIMAVRGTTFRVAYHSDPLSGNGETLVQTFGGTVAVTPTDNKGVPSAESRDVTGGKQVAVMDVDQYATSEDHASDDKEMVIGQFKTEENEDLNLNSTSLDSISFLLNEDSHRTCDHGLSESSGDNSVNGSAFSDEKQEDLQKKVGDTVFFEEDLMKAKEKIPQKDNLNFEEDEPDQGELSEKDTKLIQFDNKQGAPASSKQPQSKPGHQDNPNKPIQSTKPDLPAGTDQPKIPDNSNTGASKKDQSNKEIRNEDDTGNNSGDDDHSGNHNGNGGNSGNNSGDDDHSGNHNGDDDHSGNNSGDDDHSGNHNGDGGDSGNNSGDDDHSGNSGGDKPEPVMYILTCMMGSTKLSATKLPENDVIQEPEHPDQSDGGHWALQPSGSPVTFDETFKIHSNTTLYWVEDSIDQYTVVFQYEETVFCTQIVSQGELAQKPFLQPTQTGYWKQEGESAPFDFASSVIHSDTTLNWIAESMTP